MSSDLLLFPGGPFRDAREHIAILCKALAYAATDPDGAAFVRAFLKAKEAQRLVNEAQRCVKDNVQVRA
jgi:hypothetical protein